MSDKSGLLLLKRCVEQNRIIGVGDLKLILRDFKQLEAENERLWKFFHAGGDHDWSCDSTHGTGLPCDCGFQEVLDALLKGKE